MTTRQVIIASIVGTVFLFLFDGAFQAIPGFGVRAVERLETTALMAPGFGDLTERMVYLDTKQTVSFIATKPAAYYSLSRFFAIEGACAFLVATLFALLFGLIPFRSLRERLLLAFAFSAIASAAIHLPYMNWWGFSLPYTVGVVSKTVAGWTLLAAVQNRFVYKVRS